MLVYSPGSKAGLKLPCWKQGKRERESSEGGWASLSSRRDYGSLRKKKKKGANLSYESWYGKGGV